MGLAASVKWVRLRDGVFQYERRVPAHVRRMPERYATLFGSRPLFRRSLRTKDTKAMFVEASRVHSAFERLVAQATASVLPAPVAIAPAIDATRKVTESDLAAIADRYLHLTAEPFERLHRVADVDPQAAVELERIEYQLGLDAADIKEALRSRQPNEDARMTLPLDEARHVAREQGFAAPEGSVELGMIANAIRMGMEKGGKRVTALSEGTVLPTLPKAAIAAPRPVRTTIRDAVERYLRQRDLPTKTVSEVRLALRIFEQVVGNKALDAIDRADILAYVEHLTSQKVGGKSVGSVERFPTIGTVKKRLGFINAAINHASDVGLFDGRNPASNIKVATFAKKTDRAIMPDKRRLTVGELNKVFRHSWFRGCESAERSHLPGTFRLTGSEYWVPIVALMTGCRASELAGLRVSDVRLDDPTPHFMIQPNKYRGIKNDEARDVPILDMLFEQGFQTYFERIRSSGVDRVFPDWTGRIPPAGGYPAWSNGRIMRAFNRTVIPWALEGELPPDARQAVTFHGLRGAFKAMLNTAEPAVNHNIINEVIGHAKSDLDARYVGKIEIERTYQAVRGCRYVGLELPPPPF